MHHAISTFDGLAYDELSIKSVRISQAGRNGADSSIHLRKQTSAAIYRMSEEIPAAHIPIEPFKGPPSRGGRMWGWQKTKRAQQKHNFPRWRSEECSRNEWSFPSVPLALFSSSDRMFVFRKIDRNEIRSLLARECSARIDEVETSDIFFFFRYCYRDIFDGSSNALAEYIISAL